jgi:hypothetical protein
MECCGLTQLSLSNGWEQLNAAVCSIARVCSKVKAVSSHRTPPAMRKTKSAEVACATSADAVIIS